MQNTPLFICDADDVYLDRISRYIMGRPYSPFWVKTMREYDETLMRDIKEGIILISSNMLFERANILDAKRTMILLDSELDRAYEAFDTVYKYQAAAVIYDRILKLQLEREDICLPCERSMNACHIEINAVISPIHRIGKTRWIREMCRKEAEAHKVLLMTLEEFPKGIQDGEGLSELIYYFKQGKLNTQYCMTQLVRHGEFYDDIRPVRWLGDLEDMTPQEWVELMGTIRDVGIYDRIWIDFDHLTGYRPLLDFCDRIYIPYIQDEEEYRRVEHFEKMLILTEEESVKERITKICVEGELFS